MHIFPLSVMKIHLLLLFCVFSSYLQAQMLEYNPNDSIRIEQWLKDARNINIEDAMIHFGQQFLDVPYVGHTLEMGKHEHLIVNTRELDCTTFVENVLALYLCHLHHQFAFRDFCIHLRTIRYREGRLTDYTSRLHYFTWWCENNEKKGLIKCVEYDGFPYTAIQRIKINYMSTHPSLYKHLKANPAFVKSIAQLEQASNGTTYRYIPKSHLNRGPRELSCIRTGDIVAIITSKTGLDTSHVGIAVWQDGHLHLMHASSLYKKVVVDSNTFYDYSLLQNSQLGIRVFRPCK